MSAPYQLPPDPRLKLIDWLHFLMPRVEKDAADWANLPTNYQHIEYPYYPTRAIIQVRNLLVELRQALPEVQAPALLIHSKNDQAIHPDNLDRIYQELGSQAKHRVLIEDSSHNIVCDGQRQQVFELVGNFIEQYL